MKSATRAIASFQADVILTLVYYLALGPTALLYRLFERPRPLRARGGADPVLRLKSQG